MIRLKGFRSALRGLALALCAGSAAAAHEPLVSTDVDLELVLAVDVSQSIDRGELLIQRRGYIEALRHPNVVRAIMRGRLQRIAVTYFEWAGSSQQRVLVRWQEIDSEEGANAFAAALEAAPLMRGQQQGTSVSAALALGADLLSSNGFNGERKVIDISGDGLNTDGSPVALARDAVVASDIVINGLPLATGPDAEKIVPHYADCVTGGPGSFTVSVKRMEEFAEAIRRKLIREIAGLPEAKIIPAQAAPLTDCLRGEKLRDTFKDIRKLMMEREPLRFVERFYEDGYVNDN